MSTAFVATAASTAVPPFRIIARPAADATWSIEQTMALVERIVAVDVGGTEEDMDRC